MKNAKQYCLYWTALGLFCALPASSQSVSIIAPGSLANHDGNGLSGALNPGAAGLATVRYQQVYASSEFGLINQGGGLFTGIYFRLDQTFGQSFSTTLNNFQITASTTTKAPDSFSPLFADNYGADATVVWGPASVPVFAGKSPSINPQIFGPAVPFIHPFYYNPANGNLLIDIQMFGGGQTSYFDAQATLGDSISSLYASSASADTGTLFTDGLVTEFAVIPVPEPSSLILMAVGLGGLLTVRLFWHRRSTRNGSSEPILNDSL